MTQEQLIELYEERAAIMEYDGGLSRASAEYLAAAELQELTGCSKDVFTSRVVSTNTD